MHTTAKSQYTQIHTDVNKYFQKINEEENRSPKRILCEPRGTSRVQSLGVGQHRFHRHVLTGLCQLLEAWKESESVSHLAVCDSLRPPGLRPIGSSVHGILQARILEWVAISFSRGGLPDPGLEPRSPALQRDPLASQPPGRLLKAYTSLRVYSIY